MTAGQRGAENNQKKGYKMKTFKTDLLKGRITRRSLLAVALPATGLTLAWAAGARDDSGAKGHFRLGGAYVTLTWQSVAGVNYSLERSANLRSLFTPLATNILGQAGTTTYADTNATGAGPFFYRVGVQCP